MSYATTSSLEVLMIGTKFDTATTALATKLMVHAENEVNKYLSKRYDIAQFQSVVPPIVTSWTETLTEGYMYQRMSRGGKDAMKRGKELIDQVLKNLEDVAEYKKDIMDTAGAVIPDMSNTAYRLESTTVNYTDTFDEGEELNWRVDPDKLQDIEDAKE